MSETPRYEAVGTVEASSAEYVDVDDGFLVDSPDGSEVWIARPKNDTRSD